LNKQRHSSVAFVLAGARPFSLGDAIANELAERAAGSAILAVDIEAPAVRHANITARVFDLNPLRHACGFLGWHTELDAILRGMMPLGVPKTPICALFLNVAKYAVSRLEDMSVQDRGDMLGINFLAKCELINAVMRINADSGFDNSKILDIIDVGSLHSIGKSPRRVLYNTAKAATLALCELLNKGAEVKRAFHIAPGCLDTPMLHSNHWTLKEHGDPRFLELVRRELPSLYPAIFRDTDSESFHTATRTLGFTGSEFPIVFDRYRSRRKAVAGSQEGIILPEELASYIVGLTLDKAFSLESGILEVTAPQGQMHVTHRPF
jgi:NAD(P)-dependent dehydrogenase (short-subunit alcohol dehydrogenase family)